jgi:hypothetical protein
MDGIVKSKERLISGTGARGGKHVFDKHSKSIIAKRNSSSPENIRKKIERGEQPLERGFVRLGVLNTRILNGMEDITEWSDEEIIRGQKRDKEGGWKGRAPSVIPKALHDEAVKRMLGNASNMLTTALIPAVQLLSAIIEDEAAEDKDKLKAAQMILDRVLGKPVERVEVKEQDSPWQDAIVEAVVPLSDVRDVVEVESDEESNEGSDT